MKFETKRGLMGKYQHLSMLTDIHPQVSETALITPKLAPLIADE